MFFPKYQLTSKLLNNLTQIERLYGQLEALRVPKKLELNLERNNLIQSAYVSNSIEGNPLSLPEVTNLLLGGRVPVNRDEKEVKNYFEILKSLDNYISQPLSLTLINEVHQKLLTGVDDKIAGQIRNKRVVVGHYEDEQGKMAVNVKHEPPAHDRAAIETQLQDLLNWTETNQEVPPLLKIGSFHHQFVYIHPFEDGNGRVCRLLTALNFLKNNYQINKYFVLDDYYDIDRLQYSDKLNSADKGDKTEWLEYFTDGVTYSLQSALGKAKSAMETVSVKERLSPRETEVLEIFKTKNEFTSMDLAQELRVTRQQAHQLLSNLVDKGFVKKQGSTKSSYYVLK